MKLTLNQIMEGILRELKTLQFDLVVGIERGGILPAYLASRCLDKPMKTLRIRFRDNQHKPMVQKPILEKKMEETVTGLRILLTDDVSNSGATLQRGIEELEGNSVTTLVISGEADISLFGPHNSCIEWPWDFRNV